jgi:beta-phosphoglucomutase
MKKRFEFNYRAVIFDMDGVITNTMPYHFDAWLSVLKAAGIKVSCYDVYQREGQAGLTTIKELFQQHHIKFSIDQANALLRQKEELFKKTVKIGFIKGSRPFIRKLKRRGLRLGLVTGTSRHEMEKILPRSLRRLFDVIVTGDEVRKGKPHPEPFLKAVKALKLKPKEIMVIENAPFGIRSAKAAGLFCAALETSLPRKYLLAADAILGSFEELNNLVFPGVKQ